MLFSNGYKSFPLISCLLWLNRNFEKMWTSRLYYSRSQKQLPNSRLQNGDWKGHKCYYHSNRNYYQNPNQFDPDRFRGEEKSKRDPITFSAFGGGQRNWLVSFWLNYAINLILINFFFDSIGIRFAMMQDKIALVLLLNSFEFSLSSETTVPLNINKSSVVYSPQGGVYLKVKSLKL